MRLIRWTLKWAIRLSLVGAFAAVAYAWFLVDSLEISRSNLAARARSVETNIVPSRVAGPGGSYFDAALELPLSLPAERVPEFVGNAFITREDQQFRSWWHIGVNPVTLARAAWTNVTNKGAGKLVGGSTITMQLVKNLLLNQEQTYDRKIREIVLAVVVNFLFSKDEVLAMYLNTAYFGDGVYGIEAAARKFFGRSVGYQPKVNLLEATMLANSVQRPSILNPNSRRDELENRARNLIAAMAEEGYDTNGDWNARDRGTRTWSLRPFVFRDMAMRFMVPAELRDRQDRLVIGFTIDTEAQLYAELAAKDLLRRGQAAGYDSSAIIVMEPDGAVVALAIGHDYNGIDIVRNGRISPGSTLKPFMYLCALENGMRPTSEVKDEPTEYRTGWVPKNFDGKYYGAVTLGFAFMKSLNTVPVELFERHGADCFADALARVGIRLDDPEEPTAVLGSEYVSLLSLAGAYATLANGGFRAEPFAVRYARTKTGKLVYQHPPADANRPLTRERPYCDLLGMLRRVTSAKGTGRQAAFDHPVWGKTGTSAKHRDALFAGFTSRYVAVVWIGRQAQGPVVGGTTGGGLPAEVFKWLMATLHQGKAPEALDCRRPVDVSSETGPAN